MSKPVYHYNGDIKKHLWAFQNLFSNIWVQNGNRTYRVPIAYAAGRPFQSRIDQELSFDKSITGNSFPAMVFTINSLTYNAQETPNRQIRIPHGDTGFSTHNYVVYDMNIGLTIRSKKEDEMFQIAETIMRAFRPEINLRMKSGIDDSLEVVVPVRLESPMVSPREGSFDENAEGMSEWEFDFNMQIRIYSKPTSTVVNQDGRIESVVLTNHIKSDLEPQP